MGMICVYECPDGTTFSTLVADRRRNAACGKIRERCLDKQSTATKKIFLAQRRKALARFLRAFFAPLREKSCSSIDALVTFVQSRLNSKLPSSTQLGTNSIVLITRSGSANPSTHFRDPFVGYFSPKATVTASRMRALRTSLPRTGISSSPA